MPLSSEWLRYYQENAGTLLSIPWDRGAELSNEERNAIANSAREFQAGESSEGRHLLRYAQEYAERTGDREYVLAIRLFIAEEQRHARDLGRFLKQNDISLVRTTFTDQVFRKLRELLHGLEISIAVLITAEIIAEVYYAVLREATRSEILRALCDQILRDELRHVQFQADQLSKLRSRRSRLGIVATMAAQRFLFLGTTVVVWIGHRKAIRRGGLSPAGWWQSCWGAFDQAFAVPAPVHILSPARLSPATEEPATAGTTR